MTLAILAGVLLAFHLYLLVHWDKVRRVTMFFVGAGGIALVLLGCFFHLTSQWAIVLVGDVFTLLGVLVSAVGAFACCYQGDWPLLNPPAQRKPITPAGQGPVGVDRL